MSKKLLCISYRFPPETYPLASRVAYMLEHLQKSWSIRAITAAKNAEAGEGVTIHRVPPCVPGRFIRMMRTLRLGILVDWVLWPDMFVLWVWPAYRKALKLIEEEKPDLIVLFMMPYSAGLTGFLLKRKTGIPVVFNLNDSPTCTDMNPSYPSRLHYRLAFWLEDRFARVGDAVIYVSKRNMERVRARQRGGDHHKFHLIRRGAKPLHRNGISPPEASFQLVYTGGMSGWYPFLEAGRQSQSLLKRLASWWRQFGKYKLISLDHRSHSPVYIGQAIKKVTASHPEWRGSIRLKIYGNSFPRDVVDRVLKAYQIDDVVEVHPPAPHEQVRKHALEADLLFMALPERLDGSPGGRISAKTYEYLMTDAPILAAIPNGENHEFLAGKPGVYPVSPKDVDAMARHLEKFVSLKFRGEAARVDRSELQKNLTHTARALDFEKVLVEAMSP